MGNFPSFADPAPPLLIASWDFFENFLLVHLVSISHHQDLTNKNIQNLPKISECKRKQNCILPKFQAKQARPHLQNTKNMF